MYLKNKNYETNFYKKLWIVIFSINFWNDSLEQLEKMIKKKSIFIITINWKSYSNKYVFIQNVIVYHLYLNFDKNISHWKMENLVKNSSAFLNMKLLLFLIHSVLSFFQIIWLFKKPFEEIYLMLYKRK